MSSRYGVTKINYVNSVILLFKRTLKVFEKKSYYHFIGYNLINLNFQWQAISVLKVLSIKKR